MLDEAFSKNVIELRVDFDGITILLSVFELLHELHITLYTRFRVVPIDLFSDWPFNCLEKCI